MEDQVDEPSALEQHLDRLRDCYRVALHNGDVRTALEVAHVLFEIAKKQSEGS